MKNIFFKTSLSLLLLLVASFSFAQKKSSITFEKTTQKFKKVDEGKEVELVYKFSNYGKFNLKIIPPIVDCSCTEVIIPEYEISSGTKDSIIIRFNTNDKIGWQERNVTLLFKADFLPKPIKKVLTFKGMVKASKATKKAYKQNK
ncbi:MAG: DUF1573 domain-containing protein [Vicingaceae bacterium]